MAKGPTTNCSEQNAERTMQVASYGMDWMREMTEQSLNQSRTMFEGFLTTARKAVDDLDQQACEIRERSMSLAAETLSNTFNFAHKAIRVSEPQELVQLQSEFVSRQAQALADQSKELAQTIVKGANEVGRTTTQGIAEASRKGSQAA
jgi:phasin family protein